MFEAIQAHKHTLTPLRIRSLVDKMQRQIASLVNRVVGLSNKVKISTFVGRRANDLITAVAVIMGAVAFGLWWSSFSAGLFACFGLFFLAGIYKATGQIVAAVLRWEGEPTAGMRANWDPYAKASQRNTETIAAIEHLQSWVANEISPTEENAKASCPILLESVAPRYTK